MTIKKFERLYTAMSDNGGSGAIGTLLANANSTNTSSKDRKNTSWYEALARAWGDVLDQQAQNIENLSDQIGNKGEDQPSQMLALSAASQRFGFTSTNASTATNSVGDALQTLGKKT